MENTSLVEAQNDLARIPQSCTSTSRRPLLQMQLHGLSSRSANRESGSRASASTPIASCSRRPGRQIPLPVRSTAGSLSPLSSAGTTWCATGRRCLKPHVARQRHNPAGRSAQGRGRLPRRRIHLHSRMHACCWHCGPAGGQMPITGRMADVLVAAHCIERAIEALLAPAPIASRTSTRRSTGFAECIRAVPSLASTRSR